MTYLWTTGASGYSFGSFFGVRMWQGKAMLVSIVLPLVLLTGARLVRSGSLRHHLLFGAALVAAVGASNTAVFLAPLLVAGIALAALALRRPRGALRLGAWLAYPLAAGAVSVLLAPASPTVAQRLAEGFTVTSGATTVADPLLTVPGRHGILVVTCLAIGLGALGIRNVVLRLTTTGALVAAGLTLLPGVRDLLSAIGLTAVLWRLWWVVPVPLLLAGLVGAATGRVAERPRVVVAAVAASAAAVVGLVPLVNGRWVGAEGNGARLASPLSWKVPGGALREARFVESVSEPGDTVLAPWDTSRVLAALSVEVQPVSARRFYLPSYAGTSEAHAGEREVLQVFADERTPQSDTIGEPLELLGVDTACVGRSRGRAIAAPRGQRVRGRRARREPSPACAAERAGRARPPRPDRHPASDPRLSARGRAGPPSPRPRRRAPTTRGRWGSCPARAPGRSCSGRRRGSGRCTAARRRPARVARRP